MEHGPKLAEGKTKIVYAHPHDPSLAIIRHKDGITAGDGARRHVIPGKGALSGRTAANVFALLGRAGIATHFVAAPTPDTMVVRRCRMIPLEVVTRRIATGSYLRRHPDVPEGTRFEPPLVEFFLKDDARHDPQVTAADITALGVADPAEVERMAAVATEVFLLLERAWAAQGVTLCDLKIEFGRPEAGDERWAMSDGETGSAGVGQPIAHHVSPDALLVADVIDNDSWRIWPGGEKARMLDKQVYRNMADVTPEGLAGVRARYETVAALTDAWREWDPFKR
ncbi:MAG TPA: phosphoribosylaminoimidazolesuccinocarboxamide synthase [Roseiflexaceae bacterium]|nr:phosphoribosylaminoimidazolesuccinocarboxamide synthase [Roseiflexaceae bacterium]